MFGLVTIHYHPNDKYYKQYQEIISEKYEVCLPCQSWIFNIRFINGIFTEYITSFAHIDKCVKYV